MGASGKSATAQSTQAATSAGSAAGSNQQLMRPGLNPSLRGISPSKPYWKQGSGVMPVSKQSSHKQQLYGNNMHVPGPSQGVSAPSGSGMGASHPGQYTRSTKHTPSYK
jgi:hypothetical protein